LELFGCLQRDTDGDVMQLMMVMMAEAKVDG